LKTNLPALKTLFHNNSFHWTMTGQYQHSQHFRANRPSTGGFQLLPPDGGDVDMLHRDGADNNTQATETSDNHEEPTKELTEFNIETGIQEFVIKESEYNAGKAIKDPVNSLLYGLTGQVTIIGKPAIRYLQVDSDKTERFLSVKLSDERSKAHLLALGYRRLTMNSDSQALEDTQDERAPARFTLYTETMAAENRGRQVEINSLQPGTTKDKVRGDSLPWAKSNSLTLGTKDMVSWWQPLSHLSLISRSRNYKNKVQESCSLETIRVVLQDSETK
jgi:hypothetical protein